MQLGMIGLGRMGANMVRRLMRDGHECVVFDVSANAVKTLAHEGAIGAASMADFVGKLRKPRAAWMMVPAAVVDATLEQLAPLMEAGDIIVDGGNSYYRDDIDRAKRLQAERDRLRRRRHERRRLGARARLLPDDRGPGPGGAAPGCRVRVACTQDRIGATHPRAREGRRHRRARLSALRTARRRAFRQDGAQRHRVRLHGGLCGRPEHPEERQYRQPAARRRRGDDPAQRS